MSNSWIGIASGNGLMRLAPERSHTLHFLTRHARRENSQCFWAVLEDRHARVICWLVDAGEPQIALDFLNQTALDSGSILPKVAVYGECAGMRDLS